MSIEKTVTFHADECDCTHPPGHHDPVTGACVYVNIFYGPCPCAATPEATRKAQEAATDKQRAILREQGLLRA